MMLNYPEVQQKVHKELDTVMRDKSAVTWEDKVGNRTGKFTLTHNT